VEDRLCAIQEIMGFPRLKVARLAMACALGFFACGPGGQYVWAQHLPPRQGEYQYVKQVGYLRDGKVVNEERVSTQARVRHDGKITLSLIGDVQAKGQTSTALAQEVAKRLERYVKTPGVTISIEDTLPTMVTAMGEVAEPGVFPMPPGATVLQALASAGGFSEFADRDHIYVTRKNPPMRVRFTYDALKQNDPRAVGFLLANGDVVTVE